MPSSKGCRAALRAGRAERPMQPRRQGIEPRDLRFDEGEVRTCVAGLAADDRRDVRRHVGRQERLDIESRDVPNRDGEHHANADLRIGGEDGVERLLVLRHEGVHVLDGGGAVPQAFHRTQQRSCAKLGLASLAPIGRLRMQRPDVERHVLEPALREHVVGMVVRVDEAGDEQLAVAVDDGSAPGRLRSAAVGDLRPCAPPSSSGDAHRCDAVAVDDHVAYGGRWTSRARS